MFNFSYIFFVAILTHFLVSRVYCQNPFQVPFRHCKSGPKTVSSVLIDSCRKSASKTERCILNQASRIKVNAVFKAPFDASDLEIVASANIKGKPIPLPESDNDPCQGYIAPQCPLRKGRMYFFKTAINVNRGFPIGPTDVMYGIRDRITKEIVGCVVIPITIQKPQL